MPQFQYQSLAEPSAAVQLETTQLGKWWRQPSEPPRPLRRELYGHSESTQPVFAAFSQELQLGKWWRQPSEPPRPLRRELYGHSETAQASWVAVSQEIVQLGKWWRQASEPVPGVRRLVDREAMGFVQCTEIVRVDKWQHFYPDYLRPVARIASFALGVDNFWGAVSREITQLGKWYRPPADYLRPLPRLTDRECLDFVDVTVVTVTLDKWWQPAALPVRLRSSSVLVGLQGSTLVSVVVVSGAGLFRHTDLSGLGGGGAFFHDPIGGP